MNSVTLHFCTCAHENIYHRANPDEKTGLAYTGRCTAIDEATGQPCQCEHYQHDRTERRTVESEAQA